MKIQARPLKGEAFDVDVEPSETVEALKAKVAAMRPDVATGVLKLVFSGKVLQDSATLGDSGLKEGDFLVVMAAKPKAGEAAPAPAAAPAAAPVPAPAPAPAAPVAPAPAADQAAAGMVGGAQIEETIKMMCEMGFPRSDVERALRAAFGNPDRAVEYLMTGIPQHLLQQASGQAPPAPPAPTGPPPGAQQARGMPMMPPVAPATGPLAQLQNHPLFFRLKAAVQQNPASLNQVMTVIYQQDPSLVSKIAENQEEFVRILAEPLPAGMAPPMGGRGSGSSMGSGSTAGTAATAPAPAAAGAPAPAAGGGSDAIQMMMQMMQAAQGGGAAAPPAGGAAPPPAAPAPAPAAPGAAAQLTPEQLQAVERLQGLGFERAAVIQALQACNMNEEMAASYLFDMAEDN